MADISSLGTLNNAEPLDLEAYPETRESFELPKAGRYTVRAPESFPPTAFGATQAGFLSAQIDPIIVGPTNEGFTLRFTKVSAKTWRDKKTGLSISQLGRYLRATGLKDTIPGDPQAQADAVEATAGKVYEVDVDWRAYRKSSTGVVFTLEGMKNFPQNGSADTYQTWVEDPNEKDPEGNPIRVRANLVVTRFVAAA